MKHLTKIIFLACCLTLCHCNDSKQQLDLLKEKNTINNGQENLIETENGTVIFIPEGAFLDSDDNPVEGEVLVEFFEGFELVDMIKVNTSMETEDGLLSSAAIFNIEASKSGQALKINPDKPIYIEISTEEQDENYQLYVGEEIDNSRLKWVPTSQNKSFLTTINFDLLDFYPKGFEIAVEKGMPFRSHRQSSTELVDSLFYSLSKTATIEKIERTFTLSYGPDTSIVSYDTTSFCGLNPATIKALRTEKFQQTLIATQEFATRLKALYATCEPDVLEFYINHLDKNLWEIDQMVANHLGPNHSSYTTFKTFENQKLTNVEEPPKSIEKIKKYYARRLKEIERELQKLSAAYLNEIEKENKIARQKQSDYLKLLKKREKYRMNKFEFKLTKTGWYNVAKKVSLDDLEKFTLTVTVENGNRYDRVNTYIVNRRIKSLYAMVSKDKVTFDQGHLGDPNLLVNKGSEAHAVVIAYNDNKTFFSTKTFNVQDENLLTLSLLPISPNELNDRLSHLKGKGNKNDILADLKYQTFFDQDRKRVSRLQDERQFMGRLSSLIYCCAEDISEPVAEEAAPEE